MATSMSAATNKFLTWLVEFKGASPRTKENYDVAFGQFQAFVGADEMKHFTPDNIQAFAEHLAHRNNPLSVRLRLASLSSFAKWAMRQKVGRGYLLAENPLDRVVRPQKPHGTKATFLRGDELKALLAVKTKGYQALARDTFLDTGLRVSELANANVADFWEGGGGQHYLRVNLKGGRERNVPLGPEITDRLKDSLLAREDVLHAKPSAVGARPLLVNSQGARWRRNNLTDMVARLGQRAGITRARIGAHTLRHTFNVVARVRAKLDVVTRAELLNHVGTQTLIYYDHLLAGETDTARCAVRAAMKEYAK